MKKIGIFYASSTGTTASVARQIARELKVSEDDIHDVAKSAPSDVADYDVLLMGTSTWGDGDMQDDWYDFTDGLLALDLSDKKFGVFGCGDETMADTFCNGIGELYERIIKTGAKPIGVFNEDGYHFNHSGAVIDGSVVGLVLDEVNHSNLTESRIKEWSKLIVAES